MGLFSRSEHGGVFKKYISKVTASDTLTTFGEVILDKTRMPQPVSGSFWKTIEFASMGLRR